MEYLVTILEESNVDLHREIEATGGLITYKSILMPLIIVEHTNIEKIKRLGFVESVEPDIVGNLEAKYPIEIRPTLNFDALRPHLRYSDVKVAVIDSGIDNFRILNIIESINFTSESINSVKHGTGVALIINHVVPGIQLLNAKVTDTPEVKVSNVIKAIEWAYLKGANIINLSMGFQNTRCKGTCNICQLVKILSQKNVLVVVAAGNEGPGLGTISCPGNCPEALTIGAVGLNSNQIADFSSRGRINQGKPDLVTSGYIYTTGSKNPPEGGTSFATPVISGISAGLFGIYNNSEALKDIMKHSTEKMGGSYQPQDEGLGKLSLSKLMEVLKFEKASSKN